MAASWRPWRQLGAGWLQCNSWARRMAGEAAEGGAGTRMLSSLSQVISVVVQALIPVTPAMSMIQPANSGLFALRWLGFSKGPRSKS